MLGNIIILVAVEFDVKRTQYVFLKAYPKSVILYTKKSRMSKLHIWDHIHVKKKNHSTSQVCHCCTLSSPFSFSGLQASSFDPRPCRPPRVTQPHKLKVLSCKLWTEINPIINDESSLAKAHHHASPPPPTAPAFHRLQLNACRIIGAALINSYAHVSNGIIYYY